MIAVLDKDVVGSGIANKEAGDDKDGGIGDSGKNAGGCGTEQDSNDRLQNVGIKR